jgi:hypothetical protein
MEYNSKRPIRILCSLLRNSKSYTTKDVLTIFISAIHVYMLFSILLLRFFELDLELTQLNLQWSVLWVTLVKKSGNLQIRLQILPSELCNAHRSTHWRQCVQNSIHLLHFFLDSPRVLGMAMCFCDPETDIQGKLQAQNLMLSIFLVVCPR